MANERKVKNNITIEDAKLIFKNFKGEASSYNAKGNRNFGVLIPPEMEEQLVRNGWNVKHLRPRDDDPDHYEQPWLKVTVKFEPYPPIITMINNAGKIPVREEIVDQLDWTRIKTADVVIRPYNYPEMPGRPAGVSAYLKALYVTVEEDPLEEKYRDIPYVNESGFGYDGEE